MCSFCHCSYCSLRMLSDKNEIVIGARCELWADRIVLFSLIINAPLESLISNPFTKHSDSRQQVTTGQETNTFTCQPALTDTLFLCGPRYCSNPSLPSQNRPCLASERQGQSSKNKSKVQKSLLSIVGETLELLWTGSAVPVSQMAEITAVYILISRRM